MNLYIGTAGWNIPASFRDQFPLGKSLLERYSQKINAVEINSSFYRSHKQTTYQKWAENTPQDFVFAVKMPKEITHHLRLVNTEFLLDQFFTEVKGLSHKLGPILIQLPPSLKFNAKIVERFLSQCRERHAGQLVIEPRHNSWGALEAQHILKIYHVVKAIADPVIVPSLPETWHTFEYYRLHGSPKIYASKYDDAFLNHMKMVLTPNSWVIFDNTQFGAATENALKLLSKLK